MTRSIAELLQISFEFPLSSKPIRKIALRGGGAKGVVYPGAVEALKEANILDKIDTIAGSSAGALTALMVAIGMTPEQIKIEVNKTDFNKYKDYHLTGLFTKRGICKGEALLNDIKRIIRTYLPEQIEWAKSILDEGIMYSLTKIEKDLESRIESIEHSISAWELLLHDKEDLAKKKENKLDEINEIRTVLSELKSFRAYTGKDRDAKLKTVLSHLLSKHDFFYRYAHSNFEFTKELLTRYDHIQQININSVKFIDLSYLNNVLGNRVKHLMITGTNIDTGELELFSDETTPQMPIDIAARISASYPIVFQAVEYNGKRYIDGGVLDNLPVRPLTKQKKDVPLLRRQQEKTDETIAFELNPQKTAQGFLTTVTGFFTTIQNYIKYLACGKIDVATSNEELKQALMEDISKNRIDLPLPSGFSTLDFKLPPDKKALLQEQAKTTTKQRIEEILEGRKRKSMNCDILRYLLEAPLDDIEKNVSLFMEALIDKNEQDKIKQLKEWVVRFRAEEDTLLSSILTEIKGINFAIEQKLPFEEQQYHIDKLVKNLDTFILHQTELNGGEVVTLNEAHKACLYQKVKDIFSTELEELANHMNANPLLKHELIEKLRQSPAQKEHAQFFDGLQLDLIRKNAIHTLVEAKAKPFQLAENVTLIQVAIACLRTAPTEAEIKSALETVRDGYLSRNVFSVVQGSSTRFKGSAYSTTAQAMVGYIEQINHLIDHPLAEELEKSAPGVAF
ncbi:patatin-like phospholipase family protein [Legionella sp.]|uniref:patatin-like phospholipase family protein n=1 Tax=Legionella sp. TaxID=459 RepID=UPI00321F6A4C